MFEVVNLNSVF